MSSLPQGHSLILRCWVLTALWLLASMGVALGAGVEYCERIQYDAPQVDADCLAYIASAPRPNWDAIPLDYFTLDGYQYWRVEKPEAPIYAHPNGSIIGRTGKGLVYMRARALSADGQWLRNDEGQWLHTADLRRERPSEFRGVILDEGSWRPFAWVLANTRPLSRPGGPVTEEGTLLRRYDLVYTFASVVDEDGALWHLIGEEQWLPATELALVLPIERPRVISRERWLAVDLSQQVLLGYWGEELQFVTLISSGIEGRDTPSGVYEAWARLQLDDMSGFTGAPDAYGLESVPWVLYYDGNYGFHGTYWHDGFGTPLSHGCVNLSISDSAYVYHWTVDGGVAYGTDSVDEIDTQIFIYRSGPADEG